MSEETDHNEDYVQSHNLDHNLVLHLSQCPGKLNALKFLNILSFTKHRSKQVWITERINISLVMLHEILLILKQSTMKKILSTGYSETAFNLGVFVLRLLPALLLCLNYGISKLTHFSELKQNFFDPLHIGHRW